MWWDPVKLFGCCGLRIAIASRELRIEGDLFGGVVVDV